MIELPKWLLLDQMGILSAVPLPVTVCACREATAKSANATHDANNDTIFMDAFPFCVSNSWLAGYALYVNRVNAILLPLIFETAPLPNKPRIFFSEISRLFAYLVGKISYSWRGENLRNQR